MFRKLDDTISVSEQVTPADVARAAALGFAFVVNNRPEGEQPGQPEGAAIEAAAREAGLGYAAVPIGHGGFSENQIVAMRDALEGAGGPVLAFCRSGTRSTFIWALARASRGDDPAVLEAKAAQAGYDIAPIRAMLDMLSARAAG